MCRSFIHRSLLTLSALLLLFVAAANAESKYSAARRGASAKALIIFVHGIGGDGATTWKNGASYWPSLVADDFPEVDVYIYDYASSIASGKTGIQELGLRLGEHLRSDAVKINEYRKVVFVGHSMGGLLVREYLFQDQTSRERVAGLMFFSTPSGGSDYARMGKKMLSQAVSDMSSESAATSYLNSFADRWTNLRPAIELPTWCGYEQDSVGPLLVVNPAQTRGLCRVTRPISADHFGTAKPRDKADPTHLMLKSWIQEALPLDSFDTAETSQDTVFANCTQPFYPAATTLKMMEIAQNKGATLRVSERLPLDYSPITRLAFWRKQPPKLIVIHLSCFERRPESEQTRLDRDRNFFAFLRDIKDYPTRVLAYSRSYRPKNYKNPLDSLPPDIRAGYVRQNKIFLVEVSADSDFWTSTEYQGKFRNAAQAALAAGK